MNKLEKRPSCAYIDFINSNLEVYKTTKPHSIYIGEIIEHYIKQ